MPLPGTTWDYLLWKRKRPQGALSAIEQALALDPGCRCLVQQSYGTGGLEAVR